MRGTGFPYPSWFNSFRWVNCRQADLATRDSPGAKLGRRQIKRRFTSKTFQFGPIGLTMILDWLYRPRPEGYRFLGRNRSLNQY